ncbi:MAG: penicillin acylase family protein, partial [Anaerolineales bacterium]|nr:penicillin acylase family protein [Anaerolineales bacterium]
TAYINGINAFLDQEKWPVEFSLLRHRPEPWQPLDSLAFARLQMWALSYGYAGELVRARLTAKVGPAAAELEPHYPAENPVTLPDGLELNALRLETVLTAGRDALIGRDMEGGGRGSNGWVIGPGRSTTGKPILGNDMHLPVTTPSIWYQLHLHQEDGLQLAGVSQPGMPYVLVGHNERIAWGATLAFADVEDIFLEKLELDEAGELTGRYATSEGWQPLTSRSETIAIRGRQPHEEIVRLTRHGPLIGALLPDDQTFASKSSQYQLGLALQSSALQQEHQISGFAGLNEARNWSEFAAAVGQIEAPPLNLLYADVDGNIGYYMSGRVPVRQSGDGRLPAPGWADTHEWQGYIPHEEMPHSLNPAQGYIVTCNHRVVDDRYPHHLGALWVNGYRARRLVALIESQPQLTLADCRRLQYDFHCEPGRELAALVAGLPLADAQATECQALLRGWDGALTTATVAGTVYQVFLQEMATIILEPHLGAELLSSLLGTGLHETLAPITEFYGYWPDMLRAMILDEASVWLPGGLATEATVARGLRATWETLSQRLGTDPGQWQWGRLHDVTFQHHLARQAPFDTIFSVGPFPIGGDTDTVTQTAIRPGEPFANNAFSVSNRHIWNLADFEESLGEIAPGQSGHLASPHYADMVPLWLAGEHHPLPWARAQVLAAALHHLQLSPKT